MKLSFISLLAACSGSGSGTERRPGMNPLLERYREWTLQYGKDANDAAVEAKHYAQMARDAVPAAVEAAHALGESEMDRIGVNTWAHAAWQFEKMLTNTAPVEAAKAAAKAAAPFNKAVAAYRKSQSAYDQTAQAYALRVGLDDTLAKKLMTYSNQYKLQGNKELEDTYKAQATLLANQAENYADVASQYSQMATKLHNAIPILQKDAGTAGMYAAYFKNPTNALPPEHTFPFTVAPPL
eukprot:GEMP01086289.1.p1 GENE.GEMP01086289.1~~GEMP01086289.1.p1  ORF type:complete len:239 (+),score=80.45 GEMP01086289.1:117-833(+)